MASFGRLFAAVMDIVSSSPRSMCDIDRSVGSSMADNIFNRSVCLSKNMEHCHKVLSTCKLYALLAKLAKRVRIQLPQTSQYSLADRSLFAHDSRPLCAMIFHSRPKPHDADMPCYAIISSSCPVSRSLERTIPTSLCNANKPRIPAP